MRNARLIILAFLIVSGLGLGLVDPAHAAGPWKAQVVSTETKQPLEGVVVVAFWTRNVRTFGGPSSDYHFSEETSTDSDGRFTITPQSFFSFNPLVFFRGPFFVFFKPGYGRVRWPGYEAAVRRPDQKPDVPQTYAELLRLDGVVLEMPTLQSVEERREYLKDARGDSLIVPFEKTPLLNRAIAAEREALGYRSRIRP